MAIFNTPLGMNVDANPVVFSPFSINSSYGEPFPPIGSEEITTEDGSPIAIENGDVLITE